MQQKTRAAIYTRISQDRTGAGLGVARQEEDCRALAERMGLDVVWVYADNDKSAYSGKPRPEYESLLEAIEKGEIDAVVAWHTDRLHRSATELERYIDACKGRAVPTHTVQGGDLDLSTASGRMTARVVGAVARNEVEHMVERARRKHLELAQQGMPSGGGRPFGFKPGGIEHEPEEADLIREATRRVLDGGSLAGLIRDWNEQGIKTSRGGKWGYAGMTALVRRWRNAGLREYQGRSVGPAAWTPIVPEQELRAVRALLDDPKRRTTTGRARKHLLSHIMRCGKCGSPMRGGYAKTRAGLRYDIYQCTAALDRCYLAVGYAEAEDVVIDHIARRLAMPDVATLVATEKDRERLTNLHDRRAELVANEERLKAAELSTSAKIMLAEEIESERRTLEAEADRLMRQIHLAALLVDTTPVVQRGKASFERAKQARAEVRERFKALDFDKRQAVVRALCEVSVEPADRRVRPTPETARKRVKVTPLDPRTGTYMRDGDDGDEDMSNVQHTEAAV